MIMGKLDVFNFRIICSKENEVDYILALKSNKFRNVKKKTIAKNVNVKVKFHETYLTAKVCKTLALVKIWEN